jgi:hypothetical protein
LLAEELVVEDLDDLADLQDILQVIIQQLLVLQVRDTQETWAVVVVVAVDIRWVELEVLPLGVIQVPMVVMMGKLHLYQELSYHKQQELILVLQVLQALKGM